MGMGKHREKAKRKIPHTDFIALDVGWDSVDFPVCFAAVHDTFISHEGVV